MILKNNFFHSHKNCQLNQIKERKLFRTQKSVSHWNSNRAHLNNLRTREKIVISRKTIKLTSHNYAKRFLSKLAREKTWEFKNLCENNCKRRWKTFNCSGLFYSQPFFFNEVSFRVVLWNEILTNRVSCTPVDSSFHRHFFEHI